MRLTIESNAVRRPPEQARAARRAVVAALAGLTLLLGACRSSGESKSSSGPSWFPAGRRPDVTAADRAPKVAGATSPASPAAPPLVLAAEEKSTGWRPKLWNPFASKPGQKSTIRKAGDATWGAVKGTGSAIKKGASYLNPWRKREDNRPVSGMTEHYSRNKEKEKSSGWFDWMKPKPKPKQPQTVNEWLRQERPDVR